MKRTILWILTTLVVFAGFSCSSDQVEVHYSFDNVPNRTWIGEDFWTIPLEGWHVNNGRIECLSHLQQANFSNLTYILEEGNSSFNVSFNIGLIEKGNQAGSSGVIIGSEAREEKDVRAAAYYGQGVNTGVNTDGYAFLEEQVQQLPAGFDFSNFMINISGANSPEGYTIKVAVIDASGVVATELSTIPETPVAGIIQFVNNFQTSNASNNGPRFWFDNIVFKGDRFSKIEDNRFGPILWTMHTLSRNTFKLTALMPPISETENQVAQLQVKQGRNWQTIASGELDSDSRSVTWRLDNWDSGTDHEYRVLFDYVNSFGENVEAEFAGTIRRDPVDRPLRFGLLTCQHGRGFPYSPLVESLSKSDPDILYFSGDQVYEGNGGYPHVRYPDEISILNYLGKYYMFGWAFRDLMRDIPTIVTPDDHDVFQGNLFGDGGVPFANQDYMLKSGVSGGTGDQRGFVQTARWINMMHLTQVAHLPDPYDPTPMEQNISVWYTDLNYGRVSFGIISDRGFKSPPELVSDWEGRHDHLVKPLDDPSVIDKPGLRMLGNRQKDFLNIWIRDWKDVDMKVLLTQTPFAGTATHHGNYNNYVHGDLDAGGWPKAARDSVLRIIRSGFAFHANGDQHLATVVQYGIDDFRDAGYGFSPPALSTGYSRWFRPDEVDYVSISNRPAHGLPNTGEYLDGFGNLNFMYAVGNPGDYTRVPNRYETKQAKASGFGIVMFDNDSRDITMECWRFISDVENPGSDDQFPGWPLTINQFDNYGREAVAWLPTLIIDGDPDPVVEIINQTSGELEYSVRIKGVEFAPKVFSNDNFAIRLGYPEQNAWRTIENVTALSNKNQEKLQVSFN